MSRIPFLIRRESEANEEYWVKQLVIVSYWIVAINFLTQTLLWSYALNESASVYSNPSLFERFQATFWMLIGNFIVDRLVNLDRFPLLVKEYLSIILLIFFCAYLCLQYSQASVLLASFIAPVLISTLFSNPRLTRWTYFISQALLLVSTYVIYGRAWNSFDSSIQIIAASGMLLGTYLLAKVQSLHGRSKHYKYQNILENNELLEHEVKLDPLTRLYNQKAYKEMLPQIMEECRSSYRRLSIAVLDIDEFKQVNDTYGHAVGDRVLVMISQIIKQAAQAVNEEFYAFRIGGEEFVLVFPELSVDEASEICEKLLLKIEELMFSEMDGGGVTGSCGIAGMTRTGMSPLDLFKIADEALYKAENSGKNKIIIQRRPIKNDTVKA